MLDFPTPNSQADSPRRSGASIPRSSPVSARPAELKSGGCVNGVQRIGTVQIAFVQQHHHAASFQCCDGRHPVNEERVCFGMAPEAMTTSWSMLATAGRENAFWAGWPPQSPRRSPASGPPPGPHQRGRCLLPKLAPGPAGEHLAAGVHIVEAAEAFRIRPSLTEGHLTGIVHIHHAVHIHLHGDRSGACQRIGKLPCLQSTDSLNTMVPSRSGPSAVSFIHR